MKTITLFAFLLFFSGITAAHAKKLTCTMTASATVNSNCTCHGGSNGSITANPSGGTAPYTYSWSNGGTNMTETGLTAGGYTVTVTDALSCTATASAAITQPTAISISYFMTVNVSCNGGSNGSTIASVSGGFSPYTYSWSDGKTTALASVLTAGTYSLTVTDSHSCTKTSSLNITQPSALILSTGVITNVSCYGGTNGSDSAAPSGGTPPYTYSWSNMGTNKTETGLSAGSYTLTVTDHNSCTTTASATITQPAAPLTVSSNIITNVSCFGGTNGSDSAAPSGGTSPYTYSWSNGGTNKIETGLSASTYTITVTDAHSCFTTASATITQPTGVLSVSASAWSTALCPGIWDTLKSSPGGGTTPYTYSWLPAPYGDMGCNTCQNTPVMPFGTPYMVKVTDAHGCTVTSIVSITVHPFPYTTITGPSNPVCAGNSDTLVATDSLSYAWSTGATTSSIIVSPSVSTTYTLETRNSYGCSDSLQYALDTNCIGNGDSSGSPVPVIPNTYCNPVSYSTYDSAAWFTFIPADSNTQIVAISNPIGIPVPHVHRLTLYDSALNIIEDEHLPDIQGATELRIDASHLHIGHKYLVRASRMGAHDNTPGCNPSPSGECNPSQKWSFQMCFRTVPVFIPDDSGSEAPAMSNLYYESRGQIRDENQIPRFDIKAYTDNASPLVCLSDSLVSFVLRDRDTSESPAVDTLARVDMEPTGSYAQTPQRLYKMGLDSAAGYLNYFLGFVPNGVTNVWGYARVVYKNIYPNLDMQVYSSNTGTKFYFVCNPAGGTTSAGNPADIELKFNGATSVNITADSGLEVSTELGNVSFAPGEAYEDSAGHIVSTSWHANFEKISSTVVRFHTGTYNTGEPLIIRMDRGHAPQAVNASDINWSTYMGGNGDDWFNDVTNNWPNYVDAVGGASSIDFPVTAGAFQDSNKGYYDAVIASFNTVNTFRHWATYYGGSADEWANGVTDGGYATSNIYVTGFTRSTDLYTQNLAGAYNQPVLNNDASNTSDCDAFILELNESGFPVWATYYGGDNGYLGSGEAGTHLAIANNFSQNYILYVVGGFYNCMPNGANGFPTKTEYGAYNSDTGTAWILKFNSNDSLVWATDIGDRKIICSSAVLNGCAVDKSNGDFYVTGYADSVGYPILNPGGNTTPLDAYGHTAVVTKFSGYNNSIEWSTYYGGDFDGYGTAVTVPGWDRAIVTGYTSAPLNNGNIPPKDAGNGAYYQPANGNGNASFTDNSFLTSLSDNTLNWGTYYGGVGELRGEGINYNPNLKEFVVTGYLSGNGLPVPGSNPAGMYDSSSNAGSNDCFVAAFTGDYQPYKLIWATYLGGNGDDQAHATYIDNVRQFIYVVGKSGSNTFPTVQYNGGFYQHTKVGIQYNAFITRFDYTPLIPLAVNNIKSSENDGLMVYPNPASQYIVVQMELKHSGGVTYTLYNLVGETVYSETVREQKGLINKQINLSLLPNAAYILKVTAGNEVFHKKIIKLQ